MKKKFCYLIVLIILCISCGTQNISKSEIRENFAKQFFMNKNVCREFKKYIKGNTINIIDPDHYITSESQVFKNADFSINISSKRKNEYDFYIKKAIINENLAFLVLWYKDHTTALCFYPVKSEYTPDLWIIEEITTRSIK
ncbi:hypothetical protein ACKW6Q_09255 [Chryseobacterium kwangjuense]|uniref:Uncharacterized protein n=1 Tax=Chryseobacterium kwangjuense TaxID=267125 RepID=A0ABW9K1F5_9FLAO